VFFSTDEDLETTRQTRRGDSPVWDRFRYGLKFTRYVLLNSSWITSSLHFAFVALPFDQLEVLEESIHFIYTNAKRNCCRIFEYVRARGCFRKCFACFFFNFQHGKLQRHSVYDIKQWYSDQTMPKVSRKSVNLQGEGCSFRQNQEKRTTAVNGVNLIWPSFNFFLLESPFFCTRFVLFYRNIMFNFWPSHCYYYFFGISFCPFCGSVFSCLLWMRYGSW